MASEGGPWGGGGDVFLCLLPILFLLVETLRPNGLKSNTSLPLSAALLWVVRTVYLKTEPNFANAAVLAGVFDAITPMSIVFGAIFLFQTMHYTKCLPWIIDKMKALSGGHPVAEVMLVAWAFSYLVEGASGFGTPTALAAPMLAELGHDGISTVVCCLIMNTLATPFGAVGTPIWFGFSGLGLTEDDFVTIGFKTSVMTGALAHLIPILALNFLIPWKAIKGSLLFIFLSIWSCVVPAVALSLVTYEFSSILGGMCGLLANLFLIRFRVGLSKEFSRANKVAPAVVAPAVDAEAGQAKGSAGEGQSNGHYAPAPPPPSPPPGPPGPDSELDVILESVRTAELASTNEARLLAAESTGGRSEGGGGAAEQSSVGPSASQARAGVLGAEEDGDESTDTDSGEERDLWGPLPSVGGGDVASSVGGAHVSLESFAMSVAAQRQRRKQRRQWHKRKHAVGLTVAPSFLHHRNPERVYYSAASQGSTTAGSASGTGDQFSDLGPAGKGMAGSKASGFAGVEPGGFAEEDDMPTGSGVGAIVKEAAARTFPLWGTVLLLVVTRVKQLGIKPELLRSSPSGDVSLGTLGDFSVSASLVVSLKNILGEPAVSWSFAVLYVPSILPFVAVSAVALVYFRGELEEGVRMTTPATKTLARVKGIVPALVGAMSLVNLLRKGTAESPAPATLIGETLSGALGDAWIVMAGFLGALGSFFSGSSTVSNLTFGGVQQVAALKLGVAQTTLQALQCVGATNGNMVCINNIISAKTVMGLEAESEGMFIKKTAPICVLFWALSTALAAAVWWH